jgi:hypothetical protein
MNFLAPSLLIGSAAVAVPLILHFFYKARYRRLPWAAMRFLKLAIEQTSRRLRFQEYVLLALRCLALLLLAFALARPTIRAVGTGGRGEAVDAVFVVDVSYSMGARDGDKTRLDRAKDAALAVLDNLPPNSTIQLYACADRSTFLGPVSPRNIDQARHAVKNLELTSLSTDLLPGLIDAHAALDRAVGTQKEVYVFSDLQGQGFDRQPAAVKAKCEEIKSRATLLLVRCGNPDRAVNNVAVVDVTTPTGIPHTGARLPFTVHLKNTGKAEARGVTVTLEVDGKPLDKEAQQIEKIDPGEPATVTLTAKLDEAGPRVITARVQTDDIPGDDRLDRVVPVRDRVRVLVVDGTPDVRDPRESGAHFLRHALIPVPPAQADEYFVRVTVVPPEEAGAGLLGACDVCFLANVPSGSGDRPGVPGLSPDFLNRLKQFVADGGGLVIGAGDNVVPQRYNAALGAAGANLLPYDLAEPRTAPDDKPFTPAPDSAAPQSFLAKLKDEPFATVTAGASVSRTVGMTEDPAAKASRVLLRYADQAPMIASRTVGEGEVVFIGTSLDARWTDWPAHTGSYLPTIQMAMAYLTGKATRGLNKMAGEPLVWAPPEAKKPFEVQTPGGKRVNLGRAVVPPGGTQQSVTLTDTAKAGVYRFAVEGDKTPTGPVFAVAPDPKETDDLTCLTESEIEQRLGFKPVFLKAETGAESEITTERDRREWTVWVLLVLFGVACFESVWAWICGKAW